MRQLAWICWVDSPRALPFFPINLLIGALIRRLVFVGLGIAIAPHNSDIS